MLKVKKVRQYATLPSKAHDGDLGYDLFAALAVDIMPDETKLVPTGIAIQFPFGYGGIIKDRSSVATKKSLFTVAGVIDNGYIGEIHVAFHNAGKEVVEINIGDKIAQLVLTPVVTTGVEEVDELVQQDERGAGGFGSTGN
jgi:dUTP pyrophosphatase